MSDAQYIITFTGNDVVNLPKVGVFQNGTRAVVGQAAADAAKAHGQFDVVLMQPAAPVAKKEAAPAAPSPAPEPKKAEAPKVEEKKAEPPKVEEKKVEPPKAEEKKEAPAKASPAPVAAIDDEDEDEDARPPAEEKAEEKEDKKKHEKKGKH